MRALNVISSLWPYHPQYLPVLPYQAVVIYGPNPPYLSSVISRSFSNLLLVFSQYVWTGILHLSSDCHGPLPWPHPSLYPAPYENNLYSTLCVFPPFPGNISSFSVVIGLYTCSAHRYSSYCLSLEPQHSPAYS